MPDYKLIPIEQLIEPAIAARVAMDTDKLRELADSVKEIGYVHPLAVVPVQINGNTLEATTPRHRKAKARPLPPMYEIADGHRRYKVGVMLNLKALPCLVFSDKETALQAIKLHTALYREDLSAAEEAAFLADLIDKYDYTEEQLCRSVRQTVSWVNTRLALIHGNKDVFQALADRKINMAVAQQLNKIGDEKHTKYLLELTIQGGATASMVAKWVGDWRIQQQQETAPAREVAVERPADGTEEAAPKCAYCLLTVNPFNFVPALVHDYCKAQFEARVNAAAQLPAEGAAQPV
jgi:ParB/RepB/Spo0J family partition protein